MEVDPESQKNLQFGRRMERLVVETLYYTHNFGDKPRLLRHLN